MNVTTPLALLGGLSPTVFMQRHWHKKPLVIRQAIPGFAPPLDRADLMALAAQPEVESRLVVQPQAVQWKVALPLHPEYRTLPMVWYVPPLSPISAAANAGHVGTKGEIPDVSQLRIPVKYLANLLTAGDTAPVVRALERMLAMRVYQREKHVENRVNTAALKQVGMTQLEVEDMYHVMAIANYEDRFVIPSTHREYAENTFDIRGGCGFSFGNGCSDGASKVSLFGGTKKRTIPIKAKV